MEVISRGISEFINGFLDLVIATFLLWMGSLLIVALREAFSPREFSFQKYMQNVWSNLVLSFKIAVVGGLILAPVFMFITKEYLTYAMIFVNSCLLLAIYFYFFRDKIKRFMLRKNQ